MTLIGGGLPIGSSSVHHHCTLIARMGFRRVFCDPLRRVVSWDFGEGLIEADMVRGLDAHSCSVDASIDRYCMGIFWGSRLDSVPHNHDGNMLLSVRIDVDSCALSALQGLNFLGYACVSLAGCTAAMPPPFCWDATRCSVSQCFGCTAALSASLALLAVRPG